jgi:hypothetical protein
LAASNATMKPKGDGMCVATKKTPSEMRVGVRPGSAPTTLAEWRVWRWCVCAVSCVCVNRKVRAKRLKMPKFLTKGNQNGEDLCKLVRKEHRKG